MKNFYNKIISKSVESRSYAAISIAVITVITYLLNVIIHKTYDHMHGFKNHYDTIPVPLWIAIAIWLFVFLLFHIGLGTILYNRAKRMNKFLQFLIIPSLIAPYIAFSFSIIGQTVFLGIIFLMAPLLPLSLSLYILLKK